MEYNFREIEKKWHQKWLNFLCYFLYSRQFHLAENFQVNQQLNIHLYYLHKHL